MSNRLATIQHITRFLQYKFIAVFIREKCIVVWPRLEGQKSYGHQNFSLSFSVQSNDLNILLVYCRGIQRVLRRPFCAYHELRPTQRPKHIENCSDIEALVSNSALVVDILR